MSANVEYKSARIGYNCIHMYTIASEFTLATAVYSVNLAIECCNGCFAMVSLSLHFFACAGMDSLRHIPF